MQINTPCDAEHFFPLAKQINSLDSAAVCYSATQVSVTLYTKFQAAGHSCLKQQPPVVALSPKCKSFHADTK